MGTSMFYGKRALVYSGVVIPRRLRSGKRLPGADDCKDPVQIFKDDILDGDLQKRLPVPRETDVCIIGGGVIGASIAFFLKHKMSQLGVTVLEQDPTYARASTVLSAGGLRQQFSTRENVEMSLFGAEFLRKYKEYLMIEGEVPPDPQFNHAGYLSLANGNQAEMMTANYKQQINLGAAVRLLSKMQLAEKFKWLNTDGVECGTLGLHNEGWFDPASLLAGLRAKASVLGANFVQGKVTGFEHQLTMLSPGNEQRLLTQALLELPNSDVQPVKAAIFVNAAGPWAGAVAKMAGIGEPGFGKKEEVLKVMLPVEPRKRFIYVWHAPKGPGLDCPLVTDVTGAYFRREGLGSIYIGGRSPNVDKEPDATSLEVDHAFFENEVWPPLAFRVPAFEELKVKNAWAGYYDYNYVDQNLIIGHHPYFNNFVFANGSSGHGLQHSIAIGRAVTELVMDGRYTTIDLSKFSFNRFIDNTGGSPAIFETNIW